MIPETVNPYMVIGPELWLLVLACLLLIVGAFARQTQQAIFSLSAVGLFGALLMTVLNWYEPTQTVFNHAFVLDPLAIFSSYLKQITKH